VSGLRCQILAAREGIEATHKEGDVDNQGTDAIGGATAIYAKSKRT